MIEIDKLTGKLFGADCLADYRFIEAFLPGTEPLDFCNEEEHHKIQNYYDYYKSGKKAEGDDRP